MTTAWYLLHAHCKVFCIRSIFRFPWNCTCSGCPTYMCISHMSCTHSLHGTCHLWVVIAYSKVYQLISTYITYIIQQCLQIENRGIAISHTICMIDIRPRDGRHHAHAVNEWKKEKETEKHALLDHIYPPENLTISIPAIDVRSRDEQCYAFDERCPNILSAAPLRTHWRRLTNTRLHKKTYTYTSISSVGCSLVWQNQKFM